MDRVGMFLNVVLTMSTIFLEQEIVFSFMDEVGVGGFMWAASGTKSIKDRELVHELRLVAKVIASN